jgi:hypothetical protein
MKQYARFLSGLLAGGAMALTVSVMGATGSARVDAVRAGNVRYTTDGVNWMEAKAGAVLNPGATIRTDTLGVADLYLGKNGPYVRVTPDSELTLKTLNQESGAGETIVTTELGLNRGKIQGVVRKMSAASRYEVITLVGTVAIRGTKYQVSARGESSIEDGDGVVRYVGPGATAPTEYVVRSGYTFEPTLNNNRGGLVETLPSITEEIRIATGEFGGRVPGETVIVEAGYSPVPSWAALPKPFAAPGEGDPFSQPFVLPPVANPTTPFSVPTNGGDGDGDGDGEGGD